MNEITHLSNDLNVITVEINSYKSMAGQAIFEIGRRLEHVRSEKIAERHGGWSEWLREVDISTSQADRFIKVFKENDQGKLPHVGNVSFRALYEIATMPEEEREKTHVIPSTGKEKTVDEMTVRELQEVKKALKEAEEAKKRAEQQAEQARKSEEIALRSLEEAENKPPKVVERVVEDETRIQRLQHELTELQNTLKSAEEEKEQLEQKIKIEQKDAATYRQLKHDLENLQDRKESIIKQIDNAGTIGKFITRVEESFEKDLAPIKYTRAIQELNDSEAVIQALDGIVSRVEKWCQEIRSVMPRENYIDAEVIEYE